MFIFVIYWICYYIIHKKINQDKSKILIKGIDITENSVVKNTHCEASVILESYWLAIIAVFAAAGIEEITTGIAKIILSFIHPFRIKYTITGSTNNLIKVTIYNFLLTKQSRAEELASKLPIIIMDIGVVILPNISSGSFINWGNLSPVTNKKSPITIAIVAGLISDFIEKPLLVLPLDKR